MLTFGFSIYKIKIMITDEYKICHKCGKNKPIMDFYKNPHSKNGRLNICKPCKIYYQRIYEKSHIEQHRQRCLKYSQSEKGKNAKKKYASTEKCKRIMSESNKKFRKTEKYKNYIKKYKEQNKVIYIASRAVSNAIRDKKLERPNSFQCVVCKSKNAENYHHPDYSKPLLIFPVCKDCHKFIHSL
jgi:hypothetical protein